MLQRHVLFGPLRGNAARPHHALSGRPERAMARGAGMSIYTEEMFTTGHDAANRAVVAEFGAADLNLVGLALREEKKAVDKITKGAKMHP